MRVGKLVLLAIRNLTSQALVAPTIHTPPSRMITTEA